MAAIPLLGKPGETAKYIQKRSIGSGSYGTVYLCEKADDKQVVVVKVMDLSKMSARDRTYAESEIQCLACCNHPNIIKHFESTETSATDGNLLIVTEFADAGDLDRQIKSRAQTKNYFEESSLLLLFLQICLALHHVHSHRMIHRDIKGANILLCSNGLVKLGDFGFSHQYSETVSAGQAQTFLGTPYYLAPELWNNQKYGARADVWSLGVLLYEIIALQRPFTAGNMKGLMQKVMSGEYAPLPDKYSAELKELVRAILTVDVNRRPTLDDLFQFPYVRKGLAQLREAVERNSKVSAGEKSGLMAHIDEVLAAPPRKRDDGPAGEVNKNIAFEGIVFKLGAGAQPTWKERYLLLQRGHLVLCDSKADQKNGKALAVDQLQSAVPVPAASAKREHVISLNTHNGKSMWLQAPSKAEMEQWLDAIQRSLGL